MNGMLDINVIPINKVKTVTPYEGLFSKRVYLEKSVRMDSLHTDSIIFDKAAPDIDTRLKKSADTIGIYECYGITKFGFTKKEVQDMDKAYLKCIKPNFDWMDVYNFAELMYKTIAIDHRFPLKDSRWEPSFDNSPRVEIIVEPAERDNEWEDCTIYISDKLSIYNNLGYQDFYGWRSHQTSEDVSSIKEAFLKIFSIFETANYDVSKCSIKIGLENVYFNLDYYRPNDMINKCFIPDSAAKVYKDIYTKSFPKTNYPSKYKFFVKTAFGNTEFTFVDKDKDSAYKKFIQLTKNYKEPKNENKYNFNRIWEPCEKKEGEQVW